ncbi:TPA: EsaB/YukD family protein [Streptococcus agalactiae]|nr:EsaB/YukD family protein [Streptococcus agalactiae]
MNTHINITLDMGETSKDLRIPLKISVKQLVMELDSIFSRTERRTKYQLRVINKGILLGENDILAHYPVTTGDRIRIEEFY